MRYLLLSLTLFSLLISCQSNKQSAAEIEQLPAKIEEKIELFFESQSFEDWKISIEEKENILTFYKERKFKPIWIRNQKLTEQGDEVTKLINHSIYFGLPKKRYQFDSDTNRLLENEIKTSILLGRMACDLKKGVFQKDTTILNPNQFVNASELSEKLNFNSQNKIEEQIISWGPNNKRYQQFAKALYEFCTTHPIQKENFNVQTEKSDSIEALKQVQVALIQKGWLKDTTFDSLIVRTTIKDYQSQHGLEVDGKIGSNTCKILNESNYNKVIRAAISLDKIRTHQSFPKNYIHVNLAYYNLKYVFDDTLRSKNRVIIGATKTPSPQVNSVIKYVIVYPFWRVPHSIASKELLPKIQKDTNYLAKNNYKVYKKDIEQNPAGINWNVLNENKFPYRIIQNYGRDNSLGLFKLSFNNTYWIYVHDTPNKRLFNKDIRAMSHGCIRCDSIQNLVTKILHFDRLNIKDDSLNVDSLIARNEQRVLNLRQPLPIFIEYQSVVCVNEKLIFLLDIYKRDEEYIQLFN